MLEQIDLSDGLDLSIDDIVSRRTVVLGASGSGKSNTVARLVEQAGQRLPFIIVDWHGEYYGLRFEGAGFEHVLIAGRSEYADIDLKSNQAAALAERVYSNSMSVILDLLLYDLEDRLELIDSFFGAFWQQAIRGRKAYLCVLDEAHNYIPEGFSKSATRNRMKQIALEGRKFGLGMVIATQTISELSKTVLKQVELKLLHRVHMADDAKTYQRLVPGLSASKINDMVMQLRQPGQIIAVKDAEPVICQVKKRATYHASNTPGLSDGDTPLLRAIDSALIDELRAALDPATHAAFVPASNGTGVANNSIVDDLRRQLAEANAEIERLRALLANPVLPLSPTVAIHSPLADCIDEQLSADNGHSFAVPEEVERRAESREDRAQKRIEQRQRDAFLRDMQRLRALPPLIKDVLLLFMDPNFPPSNTASLANKLRVRQDSVRPVDLVEIGLIERLVHGRGYLYKSNLKIYLANHTHLDRAWMLDQIERAVR